MTDVTVGSLFTILRRRLPEREALALLARLLGMTTAELLLRQDRLLPPVLVQKVRRAALFVRAGLPLAYAVGRQPFWQGELEVRPGVLIPRPETERLVEVAVEVLPPRGVFAELGTGSGALALAILDSRADVHGYATDRSAAALRIARRNASRAAVGQRLSFFQGDLVAPLAFRRLFVDLLIMNPPYIGRRERVDRSLRHEPEEALFSGSDGLFVIRRLLHEAPHVLREGGSLLIEVGYRQANTVVELARQRGGSVETFLDLLGHQRAVLWRP